MKQVTGSSGSKRALVMTLVLAVAAFYSYIFISHRTVMMYAQVAANAGGNWQGGAGSAPPPQQSELLFHHSTGGGDGGSGGDELALLRKRLQELEQAPSNDAWNRIQAVLRNATNEIQRLEEQLHQLQQHHRTIALTGTETITATTTSEAQNEGNGEKTSTSMDRVVDRDTLTGRKNPGSHSDFAYAFVVGGCDPDNPAYRNYIYDILISAYILRADGSQADVVAFFQMSYKSAHTQLPAEDVRLLNEMNIQYQYIPKTKTESFYRIMLDKFRILSLTQYKRVLFMDGDVIPRGNLDYLFHLSVAGALQKNVVIAGKIEPANGGFFVLAPEPGDWDRILDIIKDKEERGKLLPYPHWDKELGWGQAIIPPDEYELYTGRRGHNWDFHGAFTDQGLLFHWVKYVKKSVSIILARKVAHYGPNSNSNAAPGTSVVMLNVSSTSMFDGYTVGRDCWIQQRKLQTCRPPHSDFVHFTGKSKPWLLGPPAQEVTDEKTALQDGRHYWFYILSKLNRLLDMKLDYNTWRRNHRPLLGMYPKYVETLNVTYADDTKEEIESRRKIRRRRRAM